jgi:hypothetical protein
MNEARRAEDNMQIVLWNDRDPYIPTIRTTWADFHLLTNFPRQWVVMGAENVEICFIQ